MENHYAVSRETVEGLSVITRQKAHLPSMNIQTKTMDLHEYPDIDELLLSDESTVYQCASRRDADCLFTAERPESIRAHLRSHSSRAEAKRLAAELQEAEAKAAEAQAELTARIKRKSDGSKRAALTRRERATSNGHAPVENVRETPSLGRVREISDRVDSVQATVDTIISSLQSVVLEFSSIQHDLSKLQVADQSTIEKADAYDALQAVLGRKFS